MAEPVVRFLRVSKSFGRASVLRGIELDIRPGEFLGLAGINGAGKTTLLKCLLDFCDLDEGEIRVHGVGHRRPEARRQLAFLPERFTPPYFLTGREFVRMMLRLASRGFDEARVRAMFDALDLDLSALDKPVRTYSKGMTQKLGLAACFLSDRELYILDEPMSGLDPKARACVRELLLALKGQGRTLLFHVAFARGHRGNLRPYGNPAPGNVCLRGAAAALARALRRSVPGARLPPMHRGPCLRTPSRAC